MVPIVWKGAGRLGLFFLVRVDGTDTSNTRSALQSKSRQQKFPETGTRLTPILNVTVFGHVHREVRHVCMRATSTQGAHRRDC